MQVLAHCDTKRVPETKVLAVPEPPFTRTWHPISHKHLIETLDQVVHDAGFIPTRRDYSLNESGTRMFGVWQVNGAHRSDKLSWCIGIRNSIDRSMPLGLVAGIKVFVCDNLCFSGEIIALRKHTSGLTHQSLKQFCQIATNTVTERLIRFEAWCETLNDIRLWNPTLSKLLTFEAMKVGAINPRKFNQLYKIFFQRSGRYFADPQTLGNWHNAITHLMHNDTLFAVSTDVPA